MMKCVGICHEIRLLLGLALSGIFSRRPPLKLPFLASLNPLFLLLAFSPCGDADVLTLDRLLAERLLGFLARILELQHPFWDGTPRLSHHIHDAVVENLISG